jgi:formylglycine-generating enzyme required for sulfatase activity
LFWQAPWQGWIVVPPKLSQADPTTSEPARPDDVTGNHPLSPETVEPRPNYPANLKPEESTPATTVETAVAAEPVPELINRLGMKLALIPAGEFSMGSDEGTAELATALGPLPDGFENADERPKHSVQIVRPFYLGATEVTVDQFRRFVEATEYQTDAERDAQGGWGYDAPSKTIGSGPQYNWRNCGFVQEENSPVVNVSWNDARAFCDWLSKEEEKNYRLPTEAEWEYACRAGSTTRFNSGDTVDDLRRVANVLDLTAVEALPGVKDEIDVLDNWAFTAPVASLTANQFGLFDIHGNAAEWCGDWYGKEYYSGSTDADPGGPDDGEFRLMRGGSWIHPPVRCRSAYRGFDAPDFRSGYVGFRVVCEVPRTDSEDKPHEATKNAE